MAAAILMCGREFWQIYGNYAQEAKVKDSVAKYRPNAEENMTATAEPSQAQPYPDAGDPEAGDKGNQSISELQSQVNMDIIGWLTIPNTHIDYPVAISNDNSFYLKHDLYGNYAEAGSLFMDYRCARDFSDYSSIIYGHNMKNRSMFGDLRLFADEGFLDANPPGVIFTHDNTFTLEFFAYLTVSGDDEIIYNANITRGEFLEYVRKRASVFREPTTNESVIVLSTCSSGNSETRTVLIASMTAN